MFLFLDVVSFVCLIFYCLVLFYFRLAVGSNSIPFSRPIPNPVEMKSTNLYENGDLDLGQEEMRLMEQESDDLLNHLETDLDQAR